MKRTAMTLITALCAVAAGAQNNRPIVSISSPYEDDQQSIEDVMHFDYNADGTLSRLWLTSQDNGAAPQTVYTQSFDYQPGHIVKTTVSNMPDEASNATTVCTLDGGRVVAEDVESEAHGSYRTTYTYDADNQLVSEELTEDDMTLRADFTWADGNITLARIYVTDSDSDEQLLAEMSVSYTAHPGNALLAQLLLPLNLSSATEDGDDAIDLGLMPPICYGRTLKNLPARVEATSYDNSEEPEQNVRLFSYDVNAEGDVTHAIIDEDGETNEVYVNWAEATGIARVAPAATGSQYYNLGGQRASSHQRGLVIRRSADGKGLKFMTR